MLGGEPVVLIWRSADLGAEQADVEDLETDPGGVNGC